MKKDVKRRRSGVASPFPDTYDRWVNGGQMGCYKFPPELTVFSSATSPKPIKLFGD